MNLKQVKSSTVALFVASLLVLGVGTYTENGGFQLAGGLMFVAVVVLLLNQGSDRPGNP